MKSARPRRSPGAAGAPVNSETEQEAPACSGLGERRRAGGVQVVELDVAQAFAAASASSSGVSFAVNASGAVQSRITVLITPEEADQAAKKMKTVKYRPPGK